jgi:hypothetical protein
MAKSKADGALTMAVHILSLNFHVCTVPQNALNHGGHTDANACSVMTLPDASIIQHQVWPSISLLFSTCSRKSRNVKLRAS